MQIGVVFPQQEIAGDPAAVRRYGTAIEDLGYDHLVVYDHVLGAVHADRTPELAGPVDEHSPFSDPFVLFGYLAGLTRRIGFMTGVLILPQRQTVLVAKQAADVDLLSGGRLRLGVGVGWNHVEYEALGQNVRTRGARQEEQIGLLRQLWADPIVDFAGHFDRVDRAALVPKPSRPIPIWLGGSGEKALDRAARLGDGFIFFNPGGVDGTVEAWNALRCRLAKAGRSTEDFGAEHVVLSHGVDAVTADVTTWRAAGGTHASISTAGVGSDSVDDHIEYLAAIAAALNLARGAHVGVPENRRHTAQSQRPPRSRIEDTRCETRDETP